MCPWCLLTPVCPCHRGAGPYASWLSLARAIVVAVRRLRNGRDSGALLQRVFDDDGPRPFPHTLSEGNAGERTREP